METQEIINNFINHINPNHITALNKYKTNNEHKTDVMHKKSQEFINNNINSGNFNNEKKIALILDLNDVYKDNYPEYYKSSTGLMLYNEILVNLDKENLKDQLDTINRINFATEFHLEIGISALIAKINEEPSLYNNNQVIINEIINEASCQESKSLSDPSKKQLQKN